MDPRIEDFLTKQKIGVLSVILPGNISHSATVHYSHNKQTHKIYIQTISTTVKAQPFLNGEAGNASFVIIEEWITLQMRGTVKKISDERKLETIYTIHYSKHPNAEKSKKPETIFLEFSPTWWRYSDREIILSGENSHK